MKCRHFGKCGSCTLYEMDYSEQLKHKAQRLQTLLNPFWQEELELFSSPSQHYRARAEFRIWHEGNRCNYAMGGLDKKDSLIIEECPKVLLPIEERMEPLLWEINTSQELKERLFGVEFLATTTGECLITMLYHRRLQESWIEEARRVEEKLDAAIIGRSRKQKLILSREYVSEELEIEGQKYRYHHYEGGFTQPNPFVNTQMISWAKGCAVEAGGGELLEAYCGLGNFTIPLSTHFEKVLATEISKSSIKAAKENCELNRISNIAFVRLSSEEMTQALQKERDFYRLRHLDLDRYNFSTVLVDPPRAGLDEATRALILRMSRILYISCNPETLARDLSSLCKTHRVEKAALFDQFPHTKHLECGVLLEKK